MTHSGSMSDVRKLIAGGSSGKDGVNRLSSNGLCLLASDFLLRYDGLKRRRRRRNELMTR